jgi:hypothetical protein
MGRCLSRRRSTYGKRRSHSKSTCWRNPITVFILTFAVLASLRWRVPARSKEAASSLITKSREWQKQRRRSRIERLGPPGADDQDKDSDSDGSMERSTIMYQLKEEGKSTTGASTTRFKWFVAIHTSSGEAVTVEDWARTIVPNGGMEASSLTEVITSCGYDAVFFETPPVTASTVGARPFEFVLVDAPRLYLAAHGQMDTRSFAAHFTKGPAATVFPNLGGDAILIAPNPRNESEETDPKKSISSFSSPNAPFSHLASFARDAPRAVVLETWSTAAQAYLDRIEQAPEKLVWFSTSGLGINWLHFRLDDRPKYYTYAPYKNVS